MVRRLRSGGTGVPPAGRIAAGRSSGVGKRTTAVPGTGEVRRPRRAQATRASATVTAIGASAVVPTAVTRARRSARPTFQAHSVPHPGARGRRAFRPPRGRTAQRPVVMGRTSCAPAWRSRSRSWTVWASRAVCGTAVARTEHPSSRTASAWAVASRMAVSCPAGPETGTHVSRVGRVTPARRV